MDLPYEMIDHIVFFVEDKIDVSMVCKMFNKITSDMYKHGRLNNYNDSYYLKHIYTHSSCIKKIIHHIHNYNCLKFLVHKVLTTNYFNNDEELLFILQRIFILNNNPDQSLIKSISQSLNNVVCYQISRIDVLMQVFIYDAYDILRMVMNYAPILKTYLGQTLLEYHVDETDINVVIETIENLTNRHIITFFDLYAQIRKLDDRIADKYDIVLWDELYDYLEKHIDKKKLKYFEQKKRLKYFEQKK